MDRDDGGTVTGPRLALRVGAALVVLLVAAGITLWVAKHRAHARAEDFCAATPPGTSTRAVTIRALDRDVQVRTDIEPGALVVRFVAWGPVDAAGECRMAIEADRVVATRVVRVD
jgi:hypothetical protein